MSKKDIQKNELLGFHSQGLSNNDNIEEEFDEDHLDETLIAAINKG